GAKTVALRPVPCAATRVADLQSGQADIVAGLSATQAKALESSGGGARVERADLPGYQYVFFNTKLADTPLKDAKVSQALKYAIDRRSIVEKLLGNYCMLMKTSVGH